jgi:hypothetical protein
MLDLYLQNGKNQRELRLKGKGKSTQKNSRKWLLQLSYGNVESLDKKDKQ